MNQNSIILSALMGSLLSIGQLYADDDSAILSEGYSHFLDSERCAMKFFDKLCSESVPISDKVIESEVENVRKGYELFELFWNSMDMDGLLNSEGVQVGNMLRQKRYLAVQVSLNVVHRHADHLESRDLAIEDYSEERKSDMIVIQNFRPRVKIANKKVFYLTAARQGELSRFISLNPDDIKSRERFIGLFLTVEVLGNGEVSLLSDPVVQSIYFNEGYTESKIDFVVGSTFGRAEYIFADSGWKLKSIYCTGVE